jgi:predicted HicB family RNase H-like nuclease
MARKTPQQAPLRTRSGMVLDDKKVEELVREIEDDATEWSEPLPKSQWPGRGRGRPSLTGESQHSPRVTFRLDPEVRDEAAARAEREGKTVSELARDALKQYLAS